MQTYMYSLISTHFFILTTNLHCRLQWHHIRLVHLIHWFVKISVEGQHFVILMLQKNLRWPRLKYRQKRRIFSISFGFLGINELYAYVMTIVQFHHMKYLSNLAQITLGSSSRSNPPTFHVIIVGLHDHQSVAKKEKKCRLFAPFLSLACLPLFFTTAH